MTQQGRDVSGRFTTGNPGGPGRRPRAVEEKLLATMNSIADDEAWEAICKKAVEQAINGDRHARAFLAGYQLGTPVQRYQDQDRGEGATFLRQLADLPPGSIAARMDALRAQEEQDA